MTRERAIVIASVLVATGCVLALLWITGRDERVRGSVAATAPSARSAPSSAALADAAPSPSVAPKAAPSTIASATAVAPAVLDPDDDEGAWEHLEPGTAAPGDLFEWDGDTPPAARKLSRVGIITVGVMNEAEVMNEGALVTSLRRAANEIDKLERGRKDHSYKRIEEYRAILQPYIKEIEPYVRGRIVVRGTGWLLRMDVPPKPLMDAAP